jgi:predicted metal-dependent hydrolase
MAKKGKKTAVNKTTRRVSNTQKTKTDSDEDDDDDEDDEDEEEQGADENIRQLVNQLLDEKLEGLFQDKLKVMEESMRKEIAQQMEEQRKEILDAELQKKIVAKDMSKQREMRGGYETLNEMRNDNRSVMLKLTRYPAS